MAVGLIVTIGWGFPFSCCEATKYEALNCLNYSQSPSLLIATPMEILCLPSISGSIINPLEPSLRILVSNEFDDHLPMGGGTKTLGTSKIY